MSINKRNIDTDEIAKESQGNAMPSGTGTPCIAAMPSEPPRTGSVSGSTAATPDRDRSRPRRTICACAIPMRR